MLVNHSGSVETAPTIWPATPEVMNTASRMESQGVPGRVHLSDATYELIRDEFNCEPRGTIEVKGKGPMRTWFLVGERGPHAESPRPSRDERSVTLPLETLGRAERASP